MKKKVSIIMGVYNCEDTICEAIDSIVNQSYDNWELIICDDASLDNTFSLIENYKKIYKDKIILLSNSQNHQLAYTLNKCLKYTSGDYIARMDGDDISIKTRLERQVDFLDNHLEYDLVGSQMYSFDENGDIGIIHAPEKPDKYTLRSNTPFCHATILARKYVYDALGGYNISKANTRCEDLELWFRFFKKGFQGYNIQEPLYKVRERRIDYRRRSFKNSLKVVKVSFYGFKLLQFPKHYYVYLIKPIISGILPSFIMKKIRDSKMQMIKNK